MKSFCKSSQTGPSDFIPSGYTPANHRSTDSASNNLEIEKGLSVHYYGPHVSTGLSNYEFVAANPDQEFSLFLFLAPSVIKLKNKINGRQIDEVWNAIFIPAGTAAEFNTKLLTNLRLVEIRAERSWLLAHLECEADCAAAYQTMCDGTAIPELYSLSREEKGFADLMEGSLSNGDLSLFRLKAFSLSILYGFCKTKRTENKVPPPDSLGGKLNRILEELNADAAPEWPCLQKLALELAVSRATLARYFERFYGTTVARHFLDMKMRKARKWLEDGEMNIRTIAFTLGYDKPSSFSNSFKKQYGCTPLEYKKALE